MLESPIVTSLETLFALASALYPIQILFDPVVITSPALEPIPTFLCPVVASLKAA